jgi:putative hydrolase of the HAD superfamily
VSISTVLWDADGVLQRVPHGREESMRPAVEALPVDVDGFLAEAVREERPALLGRVRWLDVLPGLLQRWGIPDAYDEVVAVWLSAEPVPGIHDLVRALRAAGVRCCLATNQDVRRAAYMREELGYDELLDESFYSCEMGVAKPDPAYFATVLDRLGVPADQVLFVDDHTGNVESARSTGLAAETWVHTDGLSTLRDLLDRHGLRVSASVPAGSVIEGAPGAPTCSRPGR